MEVMKRARQWQRISGVTIEEPMLVVCRFHDLGHCLDRSRLIRSMPWRYIRRNQHASLLFPSEGYKPPPHVLSRNTFFAIRVYHLPFAHKALRSTSIHLVSFQPSTFFRVQHLTWRSGLCLKWSRRKNPSNPQRLPSSL